MIDRSMGLSYGALTRVIFSLLVASSKWHDASGLVVPGRITRFSAPTFSSSLHQHRFVSRPVAGQNGQSSAHAHAHGSRAILKMVSYEDLNERLPSKNVIDAIDKAPGGAVVASDVAAAAGVSLSQARKDLTALASITKGDIAVSKDGELIYSFPPNINGVLSSNSIKYKALATFRKIWPALFYGIRVSFGVVLLASLFAIFSTIFFISQGGGSSDDRDDRRRDRGFGGFDEGRGGMSVGYGYNPFWGPSPFDFFYYRPYYGYYAAPGQEARDPDEMGFLESIFSYIFGDGNPNNGLEEKRLSLAANLIRENNGAVTAEQLAPFCDDAPAPNMGGESAYVDESFVLPIVTQLGGEPSVTDDGDIVYVFPELQVSTVSGSPLLPSASSDAMILKRAGMKPDATAGEIKTLLNASGISTRGAFERNDLIRILGKALSPMTREEKRSLREESGVLIEEPYVFSLASDTNKFFAGALGAVNLGGALYLGNMLSTAVAYGVRLPSYYGLVQSFFPFLLGYGLLYNAIPLVRSFWIRSENEKINKRNRVRRMWKTVVDSSVGRIKRKLRSAREMGTRMKKLGAASDDIVYDTSRPLEETQLKKETEALEQFDQMLGGGGNDAWS